MVLTTTGFGQEAMLLVKFWYMVTKKINLYQHLIQEIESHLKNILKPLTSMMETISSMLVIKTDWSQSTVKVVMTKSSEA